MHRLIKIRVIRDIERLEEQVRRRLDHLWDAGETCALFRPAGDFYETAQGLTLRLELPGMEPKNISLALAGQELIVRGRRRPPPPAGIRRFIHLEMGFGCFERCFILPIPIDPQGIEARYVDGILEVRMPRKVPLSKKIPVKTASEKE